MENIARKKTPLTSGGAGVGCGADLRDVNGVGEDGVRDVVQTAA